MTAKEEATMHGRGGGRVKGSERRRPRVLVGASVAAALVLGGCTSDGGGPNTDATEMTVSEAASPATIPQPAVPGDLPLAPESQRVDITIPTFPDPTNITNPLFPVSQQESVLLLGHVDDGPFRTEVTLLPEKRGTSTGRASRSRSRCPGTSRSWAGASKRLLMTCTHKTTTGPSGYFGEDVFDFRDGAIVVTEGTWLAGKDGPAAMIMPADPQVGDVYRPENAPGSVFEEVTVKSVTETLHGPLGPIEGGMLSTELHDDGSREGKIFAPGYGEFFTSGGGDVEALALAVPTDAASGSVPPELTTLSDGALSVFDAAGSSDWKAASVTVSDMMVAWKTYGAGGVPRLIGPVMDGALDDLAAAVDGRGSAQGQNAAIEAARLSFDLQLRYRPVTEIDLARMDLWAAQLRVDEAAGPAPGDARRAPTRGLRGEWRRSSVGVAERRRTGIEPARELVALSSVLKTAGPTRNPDASTPEDNGTGSEARCVQSQRDRVGASEAATHRADPGEGPRRQPRNAGAPGRCRGRPGVLQRAGRSHPRSALRRGPDELGGAREDVQAG